MTRLIAFLFGAALFAIVPLAPARATDARETAIRDVISRQLEAIGNNDAEAAFAFASPKIQSMFGEPWTFMVMVARGFPHIYRSSGHRFLNVVETGPLPLQRVLIESAKGSVIVRYEMIEIDGQWRINGCQIEKVDEA